ncbi:MAG TPA: hypothetical protein VFC00_25045 [Micromonosporaceae bacterium]|nr:hypothetical protein [Micromonosporaceae bacterium]
MDPPTEPQVVAADEPPTEPIVLPRWTGSAPIPPSKGKRGKRLDDDTLDFPEDPFADWPPPPPPPDPNVPRPVTAPLGSWPVAPPRPPQSRPPQYRRPPTARPPHWVPQPPRRRRRRFPWTLFVLTTLTALCCCGCIYWVKPFYDQYPTSVAVPPAQVAGLTRLEDPDTTEPLKIKARTERLLAENVFAEVYRDSRNRRVTVVGATGFILDPEGDLAGELEKLGLTGVTPVEPGPLGGHQRCGKAGDNGAVCGWADHGSIAVATFAGRGVQDSARLLRELRGALVQRT